MKKISYAKILLGIFLLVPLTLTAGPFGKLIVFGDSLSDNGNLAATPEYSFLNNPPYNQGFNNGKPAVQQLAKLLDLPLSPSLYLLGGVVGNNFAVASARAAGDTASNCSLNN